MGNDAAFAATGSPPPRSTLASGTCLTDPPWKVCYGSILSVRSQLRERPLSAHLVRWRSPSRRSLLRTESGRSALVGGTGLHAPFQTFAPLKRKAGTGWKGAIPSRSRNRSVLATNGQSQGSGGKSSSGLSEWGLRDFRSRWLSGKGAINATPVLLTFQSENFDPTALIS